ncbi:hypothetical protein ACGFNV_18180 [Streptomyces sp. NPDC048751]|uniref:hypothetical protein n=1 Tax=Streptomyces sp. NPDC048751 TaxID=3365591 RepID=UPI0037148DC6
MNTMSVNATAAPFHAAVAEARETAQAFIEDLRQPNGSRPMPAAPGEPYAPVSPDSRPRRTLDRETPAERLHKLLAA